MQSVTENCFFSTVRLRLVTVPHGTAAFLDRNEPLRTSLLYDRVFATSLLPGLSSDW